MSAPEFVYTVYIAAPVERVWNALVDGDVTRKYWGHENRSDWQPGSRWEHVRVGPDGHATVGDVRVGPGEEAVVDNGAVRIRPARTANTGAPADQPSGTTARIPSTTSPPADTREPTPSSTRPTSTTPASTSTSAPPRRG